MEDSWGIDVGMDVRMHCSMKSRMNGWIDSRMNGRMDSRVEFSFMENSWINPKISN